MCARARLGGQKLYLSHRTISSHLYRVFPKLGITSRTELRHVLDRTIPDRATASAPSHLHLPGGLPAHHSRAVLPEDVVTEAVRSLEVRWIFPGQLEPAVAGWFGRFPAVSESRTDTYLVSHDLRGLSVKVRAGRALEVKVYHGSPGILEVPGRARGHLQSWQKWSFPFRPPGPDADQLTGWRPVDKERRICSFPLVGGQIVTAGQDRGAGPGCTMELTEVHTDGQAWWSLGYEATGPADLLRSGLEAAAARVFDRALPAGVELGTDASRSFAEWLLLQPATWP